jgi:hypothetical protein
MMTSTSASVSEPEIMTASVSEPEIMTESTAELEPTPEPQFVKPKRNRKTKNAVFISPKSYA